MSFFRWDDGSRNNDLQDTSGEAWVTYKLEGTYRPASFKLRVSHDDKMVYAEFLDQLESLGNPVGSIVRIGYTTEEKPDMYPGQAFILSGTEGSFMSTNPPPNWMSASANTFNDRTMREFVLPATHNSGITKLTAKRGGYEHIDQTQSLSIYEQLKRGVRILDIRPSWWDDPNASDAGFIVHKNDPLRNHVGAQVRCGNFRANQVKVWIGAASIHISEVVDQINQFNKDYPGEVIFVRVRFFDTIFDDYETKMHHLTWHLLNIEAMGKVWLPDEGEDSDLGRYPLHIVRGQEAGGSAVYISMPTKWADLYRKVQHQVVDGVDKGAILNIDQDSQFWWERAHVYDNATYSEDQAKSKDPFPMDVTRAVGAVSTPGSFFNVPYSLGGSRVINDTVPGKLYVGFLEHKHLDWHNEYAGVNAWEDMAKQQGEVLKKYRQTPYDEPFMLKWIVSQAKDQTLFVEGPSRNFDITNSGGIENSVLALARIANARLYDWVWKNISPASFPNGIEIDNLEDGHIAALAMAIMNYHGGKPELFHGVLGRGSSNKTDEEIQAVMRREAEISQKFDDDTAQLQSE